MFMKILAQINLQEAHTYAEPFGKEILQTVDLT